MKSEEIITKSRQRVVQSGRLKKEKGVDHRAKVTLFSLYIHLGFKLFIGNNQVNNLCEICGHDEMYYSCAQLRSADEGQTTFYECTKCGLGFLFFYKHLQHLFTKFQMQKQ